MDAGEVCPHPLFNHRNMQFLILTHPDDESALRIAALLRRRHGREAVGVVSAEALAMAPRVVHTLLASPPLPNLAVNTAIELVGGGLLLSGEMRVVFNRLRSSDAPHFSAALASDRLYASAEIGAFWVSWLAGLQAGGTAVINPAGRGGALQPGFSRLEWLNLAAQAGLPVSEYRVDAAGLAVDEFAAGAAYAPEGTPAQKPAAPPQAAPRAEQRWLAAGGRTVALDALVLPLLESGERRAAAAHFTAALDGFAEKVSSLQAASACPLLELTFTAGPLPGGREIEDLRLAAINPFPFITQPEAIFAIVQMLEEAAG
jgi:hypothetical protein